MSPLGALLFVVLSTIAAGCLAYALVQPRLVASRKVEARRTSYARDEASRSRMNEAKDRIEEQAKRRRVLQNNLSDLETRAKERGGGTGKRTLEQQLAHAGLKVGVRSFRLLSVAAGFVTMLAILIAGLPILAALGIGIVAALGLPRFYLARCRKKRLQVFSEHFPTAIDLIVRGVKAGLPLNDTLRTVISDVPDPVSGEFQRIVEAQQMGIPLGEACERLYRNVPLPETNFFSIVITIQAQAGGNLSEALGNLSRVLRDRKKMRQKVQAVSMEAKVSAGIIGSIPVFVAGLMYLTAPDYLGVLAHDPRGNLILIGCLAWMGIGVLVMKKMIEFDV